MATRIKRARLNGFSVGSIRYFSVRYRRGFLKPINRGIYGNSESSVISVLYILMDCKEVGIVRGPLERVNNNTVHYPLTI